MSKVARGSAGVCQSGHDHGERSRAASRGFADLQLIAIFGAAFRNSVNPAQFGVVLTYALSTAISELPAQDDLSR